MSKYFNYFPKTIYSLDDDGTKFDSVTNIIARFAFEDKLKQNSAAFYKYEIKDSDTPEIIANKYYEGSERHWIVLLFNNIIDPQWDWPLEDRTLNEYIDNKYSANNLQNSAPQYANSANALVSGISFSKNLNNPKSYFKVIKKVYLKDDITFEEKHEIDVNSYNTLIETTLTYNVNRNNNTLTINDSANNSTVILQIDANTINALDICDKEIIEKQKQSYFDYEKSINDAKRSINLLKTEFVPAVEKEFKRIIAQ